MRIRKILVLCANAALLLSIAPAFAIDRFELNAFPVFQGMTPGNGAMPLRITILNRGRDTRGMIRVQSASSLVSYPVDLPTGTEKAILSYPEMGGYADIKIDLDAQDGSASIVYKPSFRTSLQQVAVISDTPGALALSRHNETNQESLSQAYARPG